MTDLAVASGFFAKHAREYEENNLAVLPPTAGKENALTDSQSSRQFHPGSVQIVCSRDRTLS